MGHGMGQWSVSTNQNVDLKPSLEVRAQLAEKTGLPIDKVSIWFTNKRFKQGYSKRHHRSQQSQPRRQGTPPLQSLENTVIKAASRPKEDSGSSFLGGGNARELSPASVSSSRLEVVMPASSCYPERPIPIRVFYRQLETPMPLPMQPMQPQRTMLQPMQPRITMPQPMLLSPSDHSSQTKKQKSSVYAVDFDPLHQGASGMPIAMASDAKMFDAQHAVSIKASTVFPYMGNSFMPSSSIKGCPVGGSTSGFHPWTSQRSLKEYQNILEKRGLQAERSQLFKPSVATLSTRLSSVPAVGSDGTVQHYYPVDTTMVAHCGMNTSVESVKQIPSADRRILFDYHLSRTGRIRKGNFLRSESERTEMEVGTIENPIMVELEKQDSPREKAADGSVANQQIAMEYAKFSEDGYTNLIEDECLELKKFAASS